LIEHFCSECEQLRRAFEGKRWTEISSDTIVDNYDKLPLFTPDAYAYYIPAFLTYALNEGPEDNDVFEFLMYSLSPVGEESRSFWDLRKAKVDAAQIRTICDFLNLISLEADEFQRDVKSGLEFFECECIGS